MINTTFTELLPKIASHFGLDKLSQDEYGLCELILNDRVVIMLRADEILNRLTLLGPILGFSGPEARSAASQLFFCYSINALNKDGPCFARSEELGLIAFKHLSLDELNVENVSKEIANFYDWLSLVSLPAETQQELPLHTQSTQSVKWG